MQWTYEIKGSHPQYKIPEVGGGRIANRLSKDVLQIQKAKQANKKNFIKEKSPRNKFNYLLGGVQICGFFLVTIKFSSLIPMPADSQSITQLPIT
jgi:hypothetical protein